MKRFICCLFVFIMTFLTACGEKSDSELKTYGDTVHNDTLRVCVDCALADLSRSINQEYENRKSKDISTILEFHVRFEQIVPFEDGNGRIGRLIMFKECLRNDITPFIIDDKHRSQYLAGLAAWEDDQTMLMRVVIRAQERFTQQLKRQASRESYWRKPGEAEDDNVEDFCDEEEDDNENE